MAKNLKRIRSGFGIGDNIYMQSVARYLVWKGVNLQICTHYPEVFLPLKGKVEFDEFSRHNISILSHYTSFKQRSGTTQWEDICATAKIPIVELKLDWEIQNLYLAREVWREANGRPIVVVLMMRPPMGRKDGFGMEILPSGSVVQGLCERYFTVQVGAGESLYPLRTNIDLTNQTTITDLFDIVAIADGVIAYPSFMVPLAESLDVPSLFVWSHKIATAQTDFIRSITPQKIMHKANAYVVDSWSENAIDTVAKGFTDVLNARANDGAILREEYSDSRKWSELQEQYARIH